MALRCLNFIFPSPGYFAFLRKYLRPRALQALPIFQYGNLAAKPAEHLPKLQPDVIAAHDKQVPGHVFQI
jgi:hypothetical protein